jgi:hypothetical protein
MSQTLTADRMRELLHYDPETGIFRYNVSKGPARRGDVAGTIGNHGYVQIRVRGKKQLAHRLAWLYVHGVWPAELLDHINRDKTDNRIANLRECDQTHNMQNKAIYKSNSSGCIGVTWLRSEGKWLARITANKRRRVLGLFTEFADAVAARRRAESLLHPFSTNNQTIKS